MATAIRAPRVSNHARWMVLLLGAAVFINYVDRGNLATAGPLIKTELNLTNTEFGVLISAFFWTYTPAQLIAGWLSQRFCAYRVLAGGLAIWAVATMATGLVGGFAALLVLRLILGLGESVVFPVASKLAADHLPPERYGQANALTAMGLSFGPAFGIYAGGLLMASQGWRLSFIIFGAVSLLWLIPWLSLKRDAPRIHDDAGPSPTLAQVIARPQAWAAAVGHLCTNYAFYFMLAWLPLYLVKTQGFTLPQMAALGGFVYLLQGVTAMASGLIADRWIAAGATANRARKTLMVTAMLGTTICMAAIGMGTMQVAIGGLILSGVFTGMSSSNIYALGQTLAGPRASGTWIGFQNCVGNFSGIVAPALTGWLVDHAGGFGAAFGVAAAVALFGVLCWGVLIGRIEPVRWSD
ncbi:MAG: MFS transporter [Sphingomonas sp.]|nr:MFS transporter [Sphingomonas sp.]